MSYTCAQGRGERGSVVVMEERLFHARERGMRMEKHGAESPLTFFLYTFRFFSNDRRWTI